MGDYQGLGGFSHSEDNVLSLSTSSLYLRWGLSPTCSDRGTGLPAAAGMQLAVCSCHPVAEPHSHRPDHTSGGTRGQVCGRLPAISSMGPGLPPMWHLVTVMSPHPKAS